MRENMRMVLTLLIIGAVCGVLLSVVNGATAPVIAARAEAQFLEALQRFFPEVDGTRLQVETRDGVEFNLCYDAQGNLLGVIASAEAEGYGGPIYYDLAVDKDGYVIGIRIRSHTETPGIGDLIEEEAFQQDVVGLNFADPIALGTDVDAVSGATVTMEGIVDSIRLTMNTIGEEFLEM